MNDNVYQAVLDCYNHPTNTIGKGWDQDETLADTAYQFQIFDDFSSNISSYIKSGVDSII